MLQIQDLIQKRQGENLSLHQYINPQFSKVLHTIGFDKVYAKASGMSLFDQDGNEYLDFLAGYGVFALGRNHPKIKQILKDGIDSDHTNLVQMEAPLLSGLLAEKLVEIFGHQTRDIVFFTNSGTEAIEGAIKFAKAATQREKLLHIDHSFHGLTTGSLAVNGNSEFRKGFGPLLHSESVLLNDLESLEQKLKTKEYAAFIFEPIQGKGVFVPDDNFLPSALQLCKKYGTISVADEVQTGIGRTGRWLASEHYHIEPDIITLSKALSGGMIPVGAIIYKKEIYEKVFSSMDRCVVHSSTFAQNNLAMISGLATLDILAEENIIANCQKISTLLFSELKALQQKHEWIKDVRGKGLMIGIEFGKASGFKNNITWSLLQKLEKGLFAEILVMQLLKKHRIITQVSGHHQDIIKLIPPLIINEQQALYFINALDQTLQECASVSGPILSMAKNLAQYSLRKS